MSNVWKTVGALVRPKGITRYSYCSLGVLNSVFYSSPSLKHTRGFVFLASVLWWLPDMPRQIGCAVALVAKCSSVPCNSTFWECNTKFLCFQ